MKHDKTGGPTNRKVSRDAKARTSLGSYKVQQRQIIHRDRVFHFVSYEDPQVDGLGVQGARSGTWYLMSSGMRVEVVPEVAGEVPEDTDVRLVEWLEKWIAVKAPVKAPVKGAAKK